MLMRLLVYRRYEDRPNNQRLLDGQKNGITKISFAANVVLMK